MSSTEDDGADEAPYVCPGCYTVGGEPCASGCIDAKIEADREDEARRGFDDWGFRDPDDPFDPAPDDGGDDVTNAVALLESALSSHDSALLPRIEALDVELEQKGDFPGARCCAWCRELVLDDFDHDFCEPEEPTEKMPRMEDIGRVLREEPHRLRVHGPGSPPRPPSTQPRVWRDALICPSCEHENPVELTAPPHAGVLNAVTSTTLTCPCGLTASLCYSWTRGAIVALRFEKKAPVLH